MHHAHVIALAALKISQRLHHLINQPRRLSVAVKHPLQPLNPEQPLLLIAGIYHPVRQQKQVIARHHRQHLGGVVKSLGL